MFQLEMKKSYFVKMIKHCGHSQGQGGHTCHKEWGHNRHDCCSVKHNMIIKRNMNMNVYNFEISPIPVQSMCIVQAFGTDFVDLHRFDEEKRRKGAVQLVAHRLHPRPEFHWRSIFQRRQYDLLGLNILPLAILLEHLWHLFCALHYFLDVLEKNF